MILLPSESQTYFSAESSNDRLDAGGIGWFGADDPENPFNWPLRKKWTVSALAILAAFSICLNGTIITVAHVVINKQFKISDTSFPNSYWPVTSWAVGGGIFSLIILPLMEDFGLRSAFLTTYVLFICCIVPQATAQNFATLIASRFFSGGCASVLANTATSLLGNVWEDEQSRTIPVSLFVTAYLAGSSAGPIIGAAILDYLSWRWISYFQLIFYGALFPIYYFFFQESRGSVIMQTRMQNLQVTMPLQKRHALARKTFNKLPKKIYDSVRRPFKMFFTEPVVFIFTLWSAFMIGTVYLFTQSTETVFVTLYGWTTSEAGYVQASVVFGEIVGWTGTLVSAKLHSASASHNREVPGTPIPEARLYVSILASFLGVTGGMFVYAWASYSGFPWIAPAIGLVMVGCGVCVVVTAIADYLFDSYNKYAASAMAAVIFVENIFAAFLPLAAQRMYGTLGFHWASTVLAFLALLLSFAPVCIISFGAYIRSRSPFMNGTSNKGML